MEAPAGSNYQGSMIFSKKRPPTSRIMLDSEQSSAQKDGVGAPGGRITSTEHEAWRTMFAAFEPMR